MNRTSARKYVSLAIALAAIAVLSLLFGRV